jgi:acyl-CoA thioester hydrolase
LSAADLPDPSVHAVAESLVTTARRPGDQRRNAELYPVRYLSRLRFSDVDVLGHLNNVAQSALHEDARTTLCDQLFPAAERPAGSRLVIAQSSLHFLNEAFYPGDLLICAGVGRVGRRSFVCSTALFSADTCVSIADSVMVMERHRRPVELSQEERAAFAGHWLGE